MIPQTQPAEKFTTYIALASFAIGTLFLIAQLTFPGCYQIAAFGCLYVLLAMLLNGIAFLNLAYQFIVYPFKRQITAIRILILLSNIPVVMLYLYILFHNIL